jgi:hypothetical protein
MYCAKYKHSPSRIFFKEIKVLTASSDFVRAQAVDVVSEYFPTGTIIFFIITGVGVSPLVLRLLLAYCTNTR